MGTMISLTVLFAALAAGAATGRCRLGTGAHHRARPRYVTRAIEYVQRAAVLAQAREALRAGRGRHRGQTSALRAQVRRMAEWDAEPGRRAMAMTSRR